MFNTEETVEEAMAPQTNEKKKLITWTQVDFLSPGADDRNVLGSCLLDKGVVEQLATRVIDVIPSALIVREKCPWAPHTPAYQRQSRARLQRGGHAAEG